MVYGNLRDGDAVVTFHGFIFYIFGYDHPEDSYHAFLKYVPEEHADLFDLDWLDVRWRLKGATLLRSKELYTPEGYPRLLESFHKSFTKYLSFSRHLDRWMITVPRSLIDEVYRPSRQLMLLMRRGASDPLEEKALSLVRLLSDASAVPSGFFGVHGSISLGMHREGSDIDVAVYGRSHLRRVKQALINIEREGVLTLKRETRFERKRLNRGVFREEDFVVNATRRFSEIPRIRLRYRPICEVEVECRCSSAKEAMFRPAVYRVEGCAAVDGSDSLVEEVSEVVSMIGLYRNVVEEGELITARGVLEEVVEPPGIRHFRVVVGSALPGEYLDWRGS